MPKEDAHIKSDSAWQASLREPECRVTMLARMCRSHPSGPAAWSNARTVRFHTASMAIILC